MRECVCASYLGTEALALCSRGVGVGGDGGAGVDVICVDVVTDPTAHRAAVVPAGHTEQREAHCNALQTVNLSLAVDGVSCQLLGNMLSSLFEETDSKFSEQTVKRARRRSAEVRFFFS